MMQKEAIAEIILKKLRQEKEQLKQQFDATKQGIGHFYVDDLLPEQLTHKIHAAFPQKEQMVRKKTLREYKYIAAQMNQYDSLLEATIYAFQDPRIVSLVGEICGIEDLEPDENLYAGGISLMAKDNYLNPHLDNSHDKDRDRWRILNLLFYVTPNWKDEFGGHLEVWPNGLDHSQVTIHSRFNRLAIMATHNNSWHSVSPVTANGDRCCVSNYYFSKSPLRHNDSFHVTSFRARPGNKIKDFILETDTQLRMMLRKIFKKGVRENPHQYRKDQKE